MMTDPQSESYCQRFERAVMTSPFVAKFDFTALIALLVPVLTDYLLACQGNLQPAEIAERLAQQANTTAMRIRVIRAIREEAQKTGTRLNAAEITGLSQAMLDTFRDNQELTAKMLEEAKAIDNWSLV
jgi:hypothetical protein